MFSQFDDKGKIFNNVVAKKPVKVIIQVDNHRVVGTVHIRPENRLKDEINQPETFLAVTDAHIENEAGDTIYTNKFLIVNRSQISWMAPESGVE